MKSFLYLLSISLFVITRVCAETVVVPGVKVSITDASAAVARERAIAQGHRVAFYKALRQLGIDSNNVGKPPSDNEIMAMAKGFSPDIERQTPTSYAASFTFQFDDQALRSWANGMQDLGFNEQLAASGDTYYMPRGTTHAAHGQPHQPPISSPEKYIKVLVPLQSLGDATAVEKVFDQLPGRIRGNTLKTFTQRAAEYELRIVGDPQDLTVPLGEKGWKFEQRGTQYLLTPSFRSFG